MAISPVAFSNEMRFKFIGNVLCKEDGHTEQDAVDLADKYAAEFGFSLDSVDCEKFDWISAHSAWREGPEELEKYIAECAVETEPDPAPTKHPYVSATHAQLHI